MSTLATFQDELQKFQEQAWDLNYAIANDPEISGEEFHACERYVKLCRSFG